VDDGWGDYFYNAWLAYAQEQRAYPDAVALATYVYERDQINGGNGQQREFDEREPLADKEAPEHAALRPPTIPSRTSRTSLRSHRPAGARTPPRKRAVPG
jgi:hypothetical protein